MNKIRIENRQTQQAETIDTPRALFDFAFIFSCSIYTGSSENFFKCFNKVNDDLITFKYKKIDLIFSSVA